MGAGAAAVETRHCGTAIRKQTVEFAKELDTVLAKYVIYALTYSNESVNKHVLHCVNTPDVKVAVDAQLFAVDNN